MGGNGQRGGKRGRRIRQRRKGMKSEGRGGKYLKLLGRNLKSRSHPSTHIPSLDVLLHLPQHRKWRPYHAEWIAVALMVNWGRGQHRRGS